MSTPNATLPSALRCLELPLHGRTLLLPHAVVTEVIAADLPFALAIARDTWRIQEISWRGLRLPLVSLERASGDTQDIEGGRRSAVVLYLPEQNPRLSHAALLLQNAPRLRQVRREDTESETLPSPHPLLGFGLRTAGEEFFVPDLAALQHKLQTSFGIYAPV